MQDIDRRVIVATKALRQVSLIDSDDTVCIEFEQADGHAAFVLVPSRHGIELIEALQTALATRRHTSPM